jgi:hypothetical protein
MPCRISIRNSHAMQMPPIHTLCKNQTLMLSSGMMLPIDKHEPNSKHHHKNSNEHNLLISRPETSKLALGRTPQRQHARSARSEWRLLRRTWWTLSLQIHGAVDLPVRALVLRHVVRGCSRRPHEMHIYGAYHPKHDAQVATCLCLVVVERAALLPRLSRPLRNGALSYKNTGQQTQSTSFRARRTRLRLAALPRERRGHAEMPLRHSHRLWAATPLLLPLASISGA